MGFHKQMNNDDLQQQISDFFKAQLTTNPNITGGGKLHSIHYSNEGKRAEMLSQRPQTMDMKSLDTELPHPSKMPVYYIAIWVPSQPYDAVIALNDGEILWLDNHVNDKDFTLFLASEDISSYQPHELAEFLLQTKFRYLDWGFESKIVGTKDDIPMWRQLTDPEHLRGLQDYYAEKHAKLDNINNIISPPHLVKSEQKITLTFFAWTVVFGTIYKLNCAFGNDGSFDWSGERLLHDVGKSFMPK